MKAIKRMLSVWASLLSLSASAQIKVLWDQTPMLDAFGYVAGLTVAPDTRHNVYLGGSWFSYNVYGDEFSQYLVMKFTPEGALIWTQTHGDTSRIDPVFGFVVDSRDNAVITGIDKDGQTTLKYAPDGTLLWTQPFHPGGPFLLTLDNQDNIFVVGGYDIIPSKYRPDGTLLWWHDFAYNFLLPNRALTDAQGNLFVLGTAESTQTIYDLVLLKYSPAGELLWSWIYDDPLHSWDQARDMALDAQGNVLITASSDQVLNPLGPGIAALVTWKLDTDGQVLWKQVYGDPSTYAEPVAMVVEPASGAVYVAGYSSALGAPLLLKYNPDGSPAWLRLIELPKTNTYTLRALHLAPGGNLYTLCNVSNVVHTPNGDVFKDVQAVLSKFDADGQEHWHAGIAGMTFIKLVLDGGRVYLSGNLGNPFREHFVRVQVQAVRSEGDISGPQGQADGVVDDWDITALILAFGSTDAKFDVNGDGKVDDTDLGIALKNFGTGADD